MDLELERGIIREGPVDCVRVVGCAERKVEVFLEDWVAEVTLDGWISNVGGIEVGDKFQESGL